MVRIETIGPGAAAWDAVRDWCGRNFAASMLVAGDMTAPLAPLTRHEAAFNGETVLGAAALFRGFTKPVVSVAAKNADTAARLLERFDLRDAVLGCADGQPLPAWCEKLGWSSDPWMVAGCTVDPDAEADTQPAGGAAELAAFYAGAGTHFWCPAMFEFGHSRVIRGAGGEIVSAGSVQFIVDRNGKPYAHIGALATDAAFRGKSFATSIIRAIGSGLARAGIPECGVFADAGTDWLPVFYENRGFKHNGSFRFAEITG